jgi:hypothetical protein
LFKTNQIALLKSWSKQFASNSKTTKNDEEVYMQLQNIQQQTTKRVEVFYERVLK